MNDDPIDDYLQALIGEASAQPDNLPPDPLAELDAAFEQAADAYQQAQQQAPAPTPAVDPLLAELDAAFEQAADAYQQAQQQAPAPTPAVDPLLAELDAAFEQAADAYQQAQQQAPAPTPAVDPLLAELDAAFEQAADAYQQAQQQAPAPTPAVDPLLAELDAAFEQAADAYQQAQQQAPAPTPAVDPLLAELDAAFEQAADAYQQAQHARPPATGYSRRIPPAPIGPPVLAARAANAQPAWQAAVSSNMGMPGEQRRRASERASRWLRLRCGQQPYALELLKVQEVVLPAPLLSLRGAPPHMLGIMNLRGQVVAVMDLGLYLGGEPCRIDQATRIVVLESEGQSLGLRVSAVDDVANLSESQIEPPDTARLCRFSNHLFRGVARLSGAPMILLDANALLN